MLSTEFKAYGKFNPYLLVGEKRPDGFHSIKTIMHKAPLYDLIRIEETESSGISLVCDVPTLPLDSSNLIYQAIDKLHSKLGSPISTLGHGYLVSVKKGIPISGGMGGGSADAGAVLRELNIALGSPLDTSELAGIAAELGSDVPFFVYDNDAMLAEGRGEILTPCAALPECRLEFSYCGTKPSTGAMYAALDKIRAMGIRNKRRLPPLELMLKALENKDIELICDLMYNSFEEVYGSVSTSGNDELSRIREEMTASGASAVILCGSGPTVCSVFKN